MSNRWEILEQSGGVMDLRLNGRALRYDLDDLEEALQVIGRSGKLERDDSVFLVESDGYRRKISPRSGL